MDVAPDVARALLAVDDVNGALRWYNMVRIQAATGDVAATTALLELWPLMQVADPQGAIPFDAEILDLWWQSQLIKPRAERARYAARVFALLEAVGKPVPPVYWSALYEGAEPNEVTMPALPIWRGAVSAGQGGRLGEAILMGLVSIGDQGPGAANPAVVANVIEALTSVGLVREARMLAMEALLSAEN